MIDSDPIARQLRRRRAAALRCPPLESGHRDPLDARCAPAGPGTFGLSAVELVAEARRLRGQGWDCWEVSVRLAQPELAGATS